MNMLTSTPSTTLPFDFAALKTRQRATWSSGDYARIGVTLQLAAELLCEAVDLRAGQRVLDVATGNGATALAAARRFTDVVAIDYVPTLLEAGRRRAAAEGFDIDFRDGDAEALPLDAGSFDVVLSTFGVMFAPDHARAAAELVRVCRPGGTIGLASWTPEGVLGDCFRVLAQYVPPPAGLEPAVSWGAEAHLRQLFGKTVRGYEIERRQFPFRYHSFDHWLELFRTYYGPVHRTFATLDGSGQAALTEDLRVLLTRWNQAQDGTLAYPGEYLEVVLTKA